MCGQDFFNLAITKPNYMNIHGPIIIIENDADEISLLTEIISDLGYNNPIVAIQNSSSAVQAIKDAEKPFMVLSAINLMGLSGLEVRDKILQEASLARKCTPYIFYSAHATPETREAVFSRQANGYIHDVNDYHKLGETMDIVMRYWKMSGHVA